MADNPRVEVRVANQPPGLAGTLRLAWTGMVRARHRLRAAIRKNDHNAAALAQRQGAFALRYTDQIATQARTTAQDALAQERAQLENQKLALEIQQQQVALDTQRLGLQRAELRLYSERIQTALNIAGKMVDQLQPGADPALRAMLAQALLPDLLQLAGVQDDTRDRLAALEAATRSIPAPASATRKSGYPERLTPDQHRVGHATLMAAFPKTTELALLVRQELDESLSSIVSNPADLRGVVTELLDWAEATGRLPELLEGLARTNPKNTRLQEWLASLKQ